MKIRWLCRRYDTLLSLFLLMVVPIHVIRQCHPHTEKHNGIFGVSAFEVFTPSQQQRVRLSSSSVLTRSSPLRATVIEVDNSFSHDDSKDDAGHGCDEYVTTTTTTNATARIWLESQPSNGVYTVIRCDAYGCTTPTNSSTSDYRWKVWGQEFHLHRLRESYRLFLQSQSEGNPSLERQLLVKLDADLDEATRQSLVLISRLLEASLAESMIMEQSTKSSKWNENNISPPLVMMVTLLWHPLSDNSLDIRVQGHCVRAALTGITTPTSSSPETVGTTTSINYNNVQRLLSYDPVPISAAVAWSLDSKLLPNRQAIPSAKLSAWCSQRRHLETLFMKHVVLANSPKNCRSYEGGAYEGVAVDEVILTNVNNNDSEVHLLEGLTSNLFVVYPNGVIRTAGTGVLHGYARHLICSAAARHPINEHGQKLSIDAVTPIRLADAHDQWQEVFITSAIRLIVPVERILAPVRGDTPVHPDQPTKLQTIWCRSDCSHRDSLIWKDLYKSILHHEYSIEA